MRLREEGRESDWRGGVVRDEWQMTIKGTFKLTLSHPTSIER